MATLPTNRTVANTPAEHVGDHNLAHAVLNRTGWHLTRVANQSITQSTVTAISWDTEIEDTPGNFAAPGTTLTVPAGLDGLWAITFQTIYGAAVDYNIIVGQIVAGGITFQSTDSDDATFVLTPIMTMTVIVPLAVGNTIVASTRHNAVAAQNITGRILAYRVAL